MSRVPGDSPFGVYAQVYGAPDDAARDRMRARLLEHARKRATGRRRLIHWTQAAFVTAAATVALIVALRWPVSESGPSAVALLETVDDPQSLQLEHGSTAVLAEHARVRIVRNDHTGAELELLGGAMTMNVEHREGVRWAVRVGSYTVEAVGTKFRVQWSDRIPEVTVFEGVVRLAGPGLPSEGMRIGPTVAVDEMASPPAALVETVPYAQNDEKSVHQEPQASSPVPRFRRRPDSGDWLSSFRRAASAGELRDAASLLPEDFMNETRMSAKDLLDAGDALRTKGDARSAARAYEAACRRGATTRTCGVASVRRAITLAELGDRDAAIDIVTRYLTANPSGSLAGEALGRRMSWHWERGDVNEAREDARRYLERWPSGPRSVVAERILSGSKPPASTAGRPR